jgi:ankyrin repeat protein
VSRTGNQEWVLFLRGELVLLKEVVSYAVVVVVHVNRSQLVRYTMLEDLLLQFCRSDSLSENGLREIIEQHANNNDITGSIDYKFFHEACLNERVTEGTLRYLLEYFPNAVRAIREEGRSPLHFICYNKNVTLGIVQLLIDAFPEYIRHENNEGHMPLHRFCDKEHLDDKVGLEILKLLLEKCPESVRHANIKGNLPLHFAAAWKSPEFCRILIEEYPGSERMANDDGMLPFHIACLLCTVAMVKYFYKLYPEIINVADNRGRYPIHFAIQGVKYREYSPETAIEIVQFLLHCDPNVASQKQSGKISLYLVCEEASANDNTSKMNVYLKLIQILYDAHPEAIDEVASNVDRFCPEVQTFINTHLAYARQARDRTVITTRDQNGQLPLHRALSDNVTLGSIKLLVKGNPSAIRTPDNAGALPLHLACQHQESASIVAYLIGLDQTTLQAFDEKGNTVLHYACRGAKYDTITLLLEKYGGISVSRRNAHNQLPIHLLLESKEVSDREDTRYVESIYRLLRAYPETVMGAKEESNSEALQAN